MKSVIIILILTLFLNYMPEDSDDELCEPQHYSWDLGTPDNIQELEIIYSEIDSEDPLEY